MSHLTNAIGAISEVTLGASSGLQLRADLVRVLQSLVSSEDVGVTSAAPGCAFEATLLGERTEQRQNDDGWRFVLEFQREVVTRFSQGFTRCSEIFESTARSRLTCVREYFGPKGLDRTITRFWTVDGQLFTVGFARQRSDFSDSEVLLLDQIFPQVAVAMRVSQLLAQDTEVKFTAFCNNYDLSVRQREVAHLLSRGLRNREIATVLHIRPNTVRNYIAELFRRAKVSTRAELIFLMSTQTNEVDPSARHARDLLNAIRESAVSRVSPDPSLGLTSRPRSSQPCMPDELSLRSRP